MRLPFVYTFQCGRVTKGLARLASDMHLCAEKSTNAKYEYCSLLWRLIYRDERNVCFANVVAFFHQPRLLQPFLEKHFYASRLTYRCHHYCLIGNVIMCWAQKLWSDAFVASTFAVGAMQKSVFTAKKKLMYELSGAYCVKHCNVPHAAQVSCYCFVLVFTFVLWQL